MNIVYQNGTKIFLELEFQILIVVVLSCNLSKWIACNVYHINALSKCQEPEAMLLFYHIEWEIKFLKLYEISLLIKHITVKFEIAVSRKVQPFQTSYLTQNFKALCSILHVRDWTKQVWRQIEFFKLTKVEHIIWQLFQTICSKIQCLQLLTNI